jgi:hypothetical protein
MSEILHSPEEGLDVSGWQAEFSPEERELIQKIKERGYRDPEVFQGLQEWSRKEEALAEKSESGIADFEFTLKRAKLYYLAGCVEEALENFQDATTIADNRGDVASADRAYEIFLEVKKVAEGG